MTPAQRKLVEEIKTAGYIHQPAYHIGLLSVKFNGRRVPDHMLQRLLRAGVLKRVLVRPGERYPTGTGVNPSKVTTTVYVVVES